MYNRKRLSIPDGSFSSVKHLFPKIDPVKAFLGRQIQDVPKIFSISKASKFSIMQD
jgi:hypothetical protein